MRGIAIGKLTKAVARPAKARVLSSITVILKACPDPQMPPGADLDATGFEKTDFGARFAG